MKGFTKLAGGLAIAAMLFAAIPAFAQEYMYSSKFVCGFQQGKIPTFNSNQLGPYEALKPGNYATTINIFNATRYDLELFAQVSVKNPDNPDDYLILPINPVGVPPFGTPCITCLDIERAFASAGIPLGGQAIEGIVFFTAPQQYWDVRVVYTYAAQNDYESHVLWGLNGNGQWGVLRTIPLIPNPTGLFVPLNPPPGLIRDIGGSGAGGLGLGASIDVEYVEPRFIDPDIIQPKKPNVQTEETPTP